MTNVTRSEAIEAAARDLLIRAEQLAYECVDGADTGNRTLESCATTILAVRQALALPPDPDWESIARQLAAALRDVSDSASSRGHATRTVGRWELERARAALSLMPEDSTNG